MTKLTKTVTNVLGYRKVADLRREHVKRIMAKRVDRPSAANDALKKIRIPITFAIDLGWRRDDPTLHTEKLKEGEHHTWTDEEVSASPTWHGCLGET